jgi:hypothetical protein
MVAALRGLREVCYSWYNAHMRPLLVSVFLIGISCAQDMPTMMKTGVSMNGRFWDRLSLDGKMGYVVGVAEGIGEVPFRAPKGCACAADALLDTMKALYGEKADALYVETVQEIDAFYKEPANKRIAVIGAMKYVAKKMSGATKQELDEYEAALRKSGK